MASSVQTPGRKLTAEELKLVFSLNIDPWVRAVKIFVVVGFIILMVGIVLYEMLIYKYLDAMPYYGALILICGATFSMCGVVALMIGTFKKIYLGGIVAVKETRVDRVLDEWMERKGCYVLADKTLYTLDNRNNVKFTEGQMVRLELFSNTAAFTMDGVFVANELNLGSYANLARAAGKIARAT